MCVYDTKETIFAGPERSPSSILYVYVRIRERDERMNLVYEREKKRGSFLEGRSPLSHERFP